MSDTSIHFENNVLLELPIGCCILNGNMEIILWNSILEVWTHKKSADVLGKSVQEIFSHLTKAQYAHRLQSVLESGSPAVFSSAFTKQFFTAHEEYSNQAQQCTATRVKKNDNEFAISIIVSDVTEQHQRIQQYKSNAALRAEHESILTEMNNRLENNNSYLDEFAYVVSHDLKAPLRNVNSLLSWLAEDLEENMNDSIRDYIDKLQQTVTGMSGLINSLLSYARAGREQGDIEEFRIDTLCEETFKLQNIPAHIQVSHDGTDCWSCSSKLLLGQVIGNILSNAIKYHDKDPGYIEIYVSELRDKYVVSVKDNGPGIEEKYHKKIFQIFQKAHTDKRSDSTGIGLALVKKIIENQGGTIYVESELGKGSEFIFSWPIKLGTLDQQAGTASDLKRERIQT
ncbi:MAG: PAS domain-containing protein [Planctomycetes bacterium]|nr:PAS domain-containing protein [Planctomycetota bacterium]